MGGKCRYFWDLYHLVWRLWVGISGVLVARHKSLRWLKNMQMGLKLTYRHLQGRPQDMHSVSMRC